jgi:predicted ATPase
LPGAGVCLVILDNFEQLARHAEATLGRWLDRAAAAVFLVTTREVLGIPGEGTLALAPLPAPTRRPCSRAAPRPPSATSRPARRRGRHRHAGDAARRPAAGHRAGRRARAHAAAARAAGAHERTLQAAGRSGGRLDRQATLRATFDWSWGLLPTAEKAALAQLSVFEGGFTLESAEAVIDLSHLDDPPWTLDVVNSLVDKSFVRPLAGDRFDLLVSVQAYATEHLQPPRALHRQRRGRRLAAAQTRHGAWFAALGPQRTAAEGARRAGQPRRGLPPRRAARRHARRPPARWTAPGRC